MINNDKRVKLEKLIERGNRRMMNTHRFQFANHSTQA